MYKRGSRVDKDASRLGWLHASQSRTIQIENNETNDCETLFPCALLEKDGEIERSRVEIEFRFLLPSFPPTPIRPPARSGWDWDEGRRREARVFRGMFVADFVHLARHVESTDLPTILSPLLPSSSGSRSNLQFHSVFSFSIRPIPYDRPPTHPLKGPSRSPLIFHSLHFFLPLLSLLLSLLHFSACLSSADLDQIVY